MFYEFMFLMIAERLSLIICFVDKHKLCLHECPIKPFFVTS